MLAKKVVIKETETVLDKLNELQDLLKLPRVMLPSAKKGASSTFTFIHPLPKTHIQPLQTETLPLCAKRMQRLQLRRMRPLQQRQPRSS